MDVSAVDKGKASQVAARGVCDRCLGRMFGKVGTGFSNAERGKAIRDALEAYGGKTQIIEPCPLCEGVFDYVSRFAEAVAEALGDVESDDFLVGCRMDPVLLEKEEEIVASVKLKDHESIKTELNREIGKAAGPLVGRPANFKTPQAVALVDARFGEVSLDLAPVFIEGRYCKLSREIPQTIWPCRACRGKGCGRCGGTGKMYRTSVQEIIGDVALEMCRGTAHAFHGMGREDIDALMLGDGRPFVLEISQPRTRGIDLGELAARANSGGLASFNSLAFCDRARVREVKAADPPKTYRALVRADGKLNKERVNDVAISFRDVTLDQRTPGRVEHRRADLVRKRKIHWARAEPLGEDTFELTLQTESGTYVKEFVSGDGGRTRPNLSDALGVPCRVEALDVLAINDRE
ncbi:MAG: tRNA pseudouridine(54/55) synthase Pus10 [Thermoplasmatales archaeon]|nr:tRNA pseudouridine(54/55) synthase Pus10 [Thermoplasmatales archaeon]